MYNFIISLFVVRISSTSLDSFDCESICINFSPDFKIPEYKEFCEECNEYKLIIPKRNLNSCEGSACSEECSPGCAWFNVNNTFCETQCFTKSCDYDGTDCPQCSPGCKLAMMGDGVCQDSCNVKACNFDQGDCPSSDSNWEIGVLMAFGVALIVLSFLCMSIFIFIYCKSRRRVLPEIYIAANSEDTVPSLTEAVINLKYPEKFYEADEKYSQTTCSICLEDFTIDVLIRQLNCEHIFHKTCITEWFLEHSRDPRCPLCKLNPF